MEHPHRAYRRRGGGMRHIRWSYKQWDSGDHGVRRSRRFWTFGEILSLSCFPGHENNTQIFLFFPSVVSAYATLKCDECLVWISLKIFVACASLFRVGVIGCWPCWCLACFLSLLRLFTHNTWTTTRKYFYVWYFSIIRLTNTITILY